MPHPRWHARFVAVAVDRAVCGPSARHFSSAAPACMAAAAAAVQWKKKPTRPAAQKTQKQKKKPPANPPTPPAGKKKTVSSSSRQPRPSSYTAAASPPAPPQHTTASSSRPRDDRLRAISFLPPPPADADADDASDTPAVARAPLPPTGALDRATALFVRPPGRFLYSAPRFLHLPVNTRTPEVCILGRSNVGKSTLLNALAGLETGGRAGRSHGARPSRLGLAITSARAGCTTMMNGYGFGVGRLSGSPTTPPTTPPASSLPPTRAARRARAGGEPMPAHRLVLLDMPGYGFQSRTAWGVEIAKMLRRRAALRGAVLLVDAAVGLKASDRQALALLRAARVRTLVVLTKADKIGGDAAAVAAIDAVDAADKAAAAATTTTNTLHAVCREIWAALRDMDREAEARRGPSWATVEPADDASADTDTNTDTNPSAWRQAAGWVPEIVVTGAGDPRGGGLGVAGARLAIGRLAGVLPEQTEKRPKESKASPDTPAPPKEPRIIPFDQIQWAATSTQPTIDQADERRMIAEMEALRRQRLKKAARKEAAAHKRKLAKTPAQTSMSASKTVAPAQPAQQAQPAPSTEPSIAPSRGRARLWKRTSRR